MFSDCLSMTGDHFETFWANAGWDPEQNCSAFKCNGKTSPRKKPIEDYKAKMEEGIAGTGTAHPNIKKHCMDVYVMFI